MIARRADGRRRFGLFDWASDAPGDVQAAEVHANVLLVECPACGARPRQRCTRPVRGGRRECGPHPSRVAAAEAGA